MLMACAALGLTAGCDRADEAGMRERLDRWFSLGDTVGFASTGACAAGAFRLVDPSIGAAMPVTGGPGQMVRQLETVGRAALDDDRQAPDQGMVAVVNARRHLGMQMRRAALEGRECMDDTVQGLFRHALETPRAVLAFDADEGSLILLDPVNGLLVVAVGAR